MAITQEKFNKSIKRIKSSFPVVSLAKLPVYNPRKRIAKPETKPPSVFKSAKRELTGAGRFLISAPFKAIKFLAKEFIHPKIITPKGIETIGKDIGKAGLEFLSQAPEFIKFEREFLASPIKKTKEFLKIRRILADTPWEDIEIAFKDITDEGIARWIQAGKSKTGVILGGSGIGLIKTFGELAAKPKRTFQERPLETALDISLISEPIKKGLVKGVGATRRGVSAIEKIAKTKRSIKNISFTIIDSTADVLQTAEGRLTRSAGKILKRLARKKILEQLARELSDIDNYNAFERLEKMLLLKKEFSKLSQPEKEAFSSIWAGLSNVKNRKVLETKKLLEQEIANPITEYLVKQLKIKPETAKAMAYEPIMRSLGIDIVGKFKRKTGRIIKKGGEIPVYIPSKKVLRRFVKKGELTKEAFARFAKAIEEGGRFGEAIFPKGLKAFKGKTIKNIPISDEINSIIRDIRVKGFRNAMRKKLFRKFGKRRLTRVKIKSDRSIVSKDIKQVMNKVRSGIDELSVSKFPKIGSKMIKLKSGRKLRITPKVSREINSIRSQLNELESAKTVQEAIIKFPKPTFITHQVEPVSKAKLLRQVIIDRLPDTKAGRFVKKIIGILPEAQAKELRRESMISGLRLTEFRPNFLKMRTGKSPLPKDFEKTMERTINQYMKMKTVDQKLEILAKFAEPLEAGAKLKPGYVAFVPGNFKREMARISLEKDTLLNSSIESVIDDIFTALSNTAPDIKVKVMQIPEYLVDEFRASYAPVGFLKLFYRKLSSAWKSAILAGRPAWTVNDAIGSATLNYMAGVRITDYINAVKQYFKTGIFKNMLPKETQFAEIYGVVKKANQTVKQPFFKKLWGGIKEGNMLKILQAGKTIPSRVMDLGWTTNRAVNQFFRDARYINASWDEAIKFLKKSGITPTRRQIIKALDNPLVKQTALDEVAKTLPGFQNLSNIERGFIRDVLPFYSWKRFMLTSGWKLPFENPKRASLLLKTDRLFSPKDDTRLDYLQGRVRLNDKFDIETRNANPYNIWDLRIVGSLNPIISLILERQMRRELWNNKAFTNIQYPTEYDILTLDFSERPRIGITRGILTKFPQFRLLEDLRVPYKKHIATGQVQLDKEGKARKALSRTVLILNFLGYPIKDKLDPKIEEEIKNARKKRQKTIKKRAEKRLKKFKKFKEKF